MGAVLGGLGAAACWAAATLCSSRSSAMIGAWSAVAWVALIGLVAVLPALLLVDAPAIDAATAFRLVLGGVGNVGGLLLGYLALRRGPTGLVSSIIACEGAVAALIAVADGQAIAGLTALALAVTAVGIAVASTAPAPAGTRAPPAQGLVLAALSACSFGAGLYAIGRLGQELPIAWALLPPRVVGVAAVALPLVVAGRLRLTRAAAPLVLVSGLAEVVGFVAFTLGARTNVAIAAVLSSLFGVLAAGLARVLFAERLSRGQVVGIALVAVGVALISATQA
jgi:drug/metabolite transporter (DMT)-like permease